MTTAATSTANRLAAARQALHTAQRNGTPADVERLQILVGNLAWLVTHPS